MTRVKPEPDPRSEFLADIICIAVEDGGYAGWRRVSSYHWDGIPYAANEAILVDIEELPVVSHRITVETIEKGLRAIKGHDFKINTNLRGSILAADDESDSGMIDVEGADVIIQAALFGQIVYS